MFPLNFCQVTPEDVQGNRIMQRLLKNVKVDKKNPNYVKTSPLNVELCTLVQARSGLKVRLLSDQLVYARIKLSRLRDAVTGQAWLTPDCMDKVNFKLKLLRLASCRTLFLPSTSLLALSRTCSSPTLKIPCPPCASHLRLSLPCLHSFDVTYTASLCIILHCSSPACPDLLVPGYHCFAHPTPALSGLSLPHLYQLLTFPCPCLPNNAFSCHAMERKPGNVSHNSRITP